MATFAEKYKGSYNGSIESIPSVTLKLKRRELEIEERISDVKTRADVTDREQQELFAIEFLKAANIMKDHLGDGIDDIHQNRIALQAMDIYTGILKELGISSDEFRL